MSRNIKVKGVGKLNLRPDTMSVSLKNTNTLEKYEDAVAKSTYDVGEIRNCITKAGLEAKDLKTSSFKIDAAYESYYDKEKNYKSRFVGYKYIHNLHIEFPIDNKVLGKLLYELSKSEVELEFSISYTVEDKEKANKELLKLAILDAKENAELFCDALGNKLGQVSEINYSWSELDIYTYPIKDSLNIQASKMSKSLDIDIEPEDISISDSVTVIWDIL